jgi:hypothetical protein
MTAADMIEQQRIENIEKMISEIYNHLGLNGERPLSINHVQLEAQKDILKWRLKQVKKKDHERKTSK